MGDAAAQAEALRGATWVLAGGMAVRGTGVLFGAATTVGVLVAPGASAQVAIAVGGNVAGVALSVGVATFVLRRLSRIQPGAMPNWLGLALLAGVGVLGFIAQGASTAAMAYLSSQVLPLEGFAELSQIRAYTSAIASAGHLIVSLGYLLAAAALWSRAARRTTTAGPDPDTANLGCA